MPIGHLRSKAICACLILALLLVASPVASRSLYSPTAIPKASIPFTVAEGSGNQQSPSIAGNTIVYDDCPQPIVPCKVKVLDLPTRQSYTLASTYRGGHPHTDGSRVVWVDRRNRAITDDVTSVGYSVYAIENGDIYSASLADKSSFPIGKSFKLQDNPFVAGNIAVWSDHRNARDHNDSDATDIYMYDFRTSKEVPVSLASSDQRGAATNGQTIVWMDFGSRANGRDANVYAYDIATKKEFLLSTAADYSPGLLGYDDRITISGNVVIWTGFQEATYVSRIYGYDLATNNSFVVPGGKGTVHKPRISGNVVVWEDWRANESLEGGLSASDIYGYDLITKQEFPIAVGGPMLHTSPEISGNTVVWVDTPIFGAEREFNPDGFTDIKGATITGITASPPPPSPKPLDSRTFPETGKTVSSLFLDYWNKNGGLSQQGYPISNVMNEVSELDGKAYTVQYFERAVFEAHPENKPPYNVLLSQLGTFRHKAKYPNDVQPPGGRLPGAISGSISFPYAYGTPSGIVFAIPADKGRYYAVTTWYNRNTYTLEGVEPGTYYLLAYFGDTGEAGYTQTAIQCPDDPLSNRCFDHSLVAVLVKPGQTTQNINLVDYTFTSFPSSVQFPPQPTTEGRCHMFQETGRIVCGKFLQYWLLNGDLPQQGLPISDARTETSELDGKAYTVQYFERAVFELHPEKANTPYEVLLSQLGTFRYKTKYATAP